MKLILTGASGLVGRYLLPELLRHGHELTLLTRHPLRGKFSDRVKAMSADLLDTLPEAHTLRADALIHLAWITTPGEYLHSPQNQRWAAASVALAERFLDEGGQRLIVAGSCAEYRWDNSPCREDASVLEADSPYAQAKLETLSSLEELCTRYSADFLWGRVFFPYGLGESQRRLVPSVLRTLLSAGTLQCTHGNQRRDFIHARDVASAFLHLLESDCPSGAYNISSGHSASIREIVSLCRQATGSTSKIEFGAIPVPDDDPREVIGVNDKLLRTGWRPQISLSDGISAYAAQLREHAHEPT